jgi:hypothetical protein
MRSFRVEDLDRVYICEFFDDRTAKLVKESMDGRMFDVSVLEFFSS